MDTFTFSFEELRPYKDVEMFAFGEADLAYHWRKAQPSVGLMNGYVVYDVQEIRIFSAIKGGAAMVVDPESDLYKLMEGALQNEFYGQISRQIEDCCLTDDERI